MLARLKAEQITPIKVKKHRAPKVGGKVSATDVVIFTRQFATMVEAGLPLVQCLEILANGTDNKAFGRVIMDVKGHVEQGSTFSDALKRHPKVFDGLYTNLIAAGEIGGILDTILQRLATYIEKNLKLVRQLKSAMVYPLSILGIAIVVVVVLLWKVIPVFERMFAEFTKGKGALPKPTQFVIDLSRGFAEYWYIFFGVGLAIFFTLQFILRTPRTRYWFDRYILKFPVIGNVLRKIVIARFTRTLGTLLSSGVPILDALEIVARSSGNMYVETGIMYTREKISEGKDMAGPLGETKMMPNMVIQMMGVGEATGAMDTMLNKIADFYEEEVDVAVASMTSMIEPIMMVFLGGVVGGLIIAMYLPIFEMAGAISAD